jgi:aspartate/methionine/tyrosine aminotransferase
MLSSFFWKKLLVRTGLTRFLPSIKRFMNGGEPFLHYLADRALAAPVNELLDPAWFPDIDAPDSINLALSSPRCELTLGALRGVNDRRPLSQWGLPELRDELAAQLKVGQVNDLSHSEVLITHGATGAFAAVIDTFVNPGDKVVLFDPTSPIFGLGLKHRRARICWVKTWLEEGKTRFDIAQFASALRGAKLLVLCDPANPTGGVLGAEDLEQIGWWAKRHDVLIFLDESFAPFRYEGERPLLGSFPDAENRLLLAGSVSKTYGLTSARVGWLIGGRHLLRPCAITASMAAPFVSPLCQQVALTALRTGSATVGLLRDEFAGRRRYLFESLQAMGFQPSWPAGGYFFWVPVSHLGITGREFARQLVAARRVLVNPGEPFGPSGLDFIRLSFATEEGRLREGMQRLAEFITERNRATPQAATSDTHPARDEKHRSLEPGRRAG